MSYYSYDDKRDDGCLYSIFEALVRGGARAIALIIVTLLLALCHNAPDRFDTLVGMTNHGEYATQLDYYCQDDMVLQNCTNSADTVVDPADPEKPPVYGVASKSYGDKIILYRVDGVYRYGDTKGPFAGEKGNTPFNPNDNVVDIATQGSGSVIAGLCVDDQIPRECASSNPKYALQYAPNQNFIGLVWGDYSYSNPVAYCIVVETDAEGNKQENIKECVKAK